MQRWNISINSTWWIYRGRGAGDVVWYRGFGNLQLLEWSGGCYVRPFSVHVEGNPYHRLNFSSSQSLQQYFRAVERNEDCDSIRSWTPPKFASFHSSNAEALNLQAPVLAGPPGLTVFDGAHVEHAGTFTRAPRSDQCIHFISQRLRFLSMPTKKSVRR